MRKTACCPAIHGPGIGGFGDCRAPDARAAGRGKAYFWIAAGPSWYEVDRINSLVKHKHRDN